MANSVWTLYVLVLIGTAMVKSQEREPLTADYHFYPTSFANTGKWKDTFPSCEPNFDPETRVVFDELRVNAETTIAQSNALPFTNKVPSPIELEYPFEGGELSVDVTKKEKTIFFDNNFNNDRYQVSYYFPKTVLPVIHELNKYEETVEVAYARMLVLSRNPELTAETIHLSYTGFGDAASTTRTKEYVFKSMVFIGGVNEDGEELTSHEIDGTKYPMEIYAYFEDPDCTLLECSHQVVILVEESDEENELIRPLVDALTDELKGLLIEERKFIQENTIGRKLLNDAASITTSGSWKTWGLDLEASHRAYHSSSDLRDSIRVLQDTINLVTQQLMNLNNREPFEYELKAKDNILQIDKLYKYSQAIYKLLNVVTLFREETRIAFEDDELNALEEDFILETTNYENTLLGIWNSLPVELRAEVKDKDDANAFLSADPTKPTQKTILYNYRVDVATLYKSWVVVNRLRAQTTSAVHQWGFSSGIQAYNFAPQMAKRVNDLIDAFTNDDQFAKDLAAFQKKRRKEVPIVDVVGDFHVIPMDSSQNLVRTQVIRSSDFSNKLKNRESIPSLSNSLISYLFPKRGGHFRYNGSTPFPPCHTVATTVVFDWPIKMSRAQIRVLTTIPNSPSDKGNIPRTRAPFYNLKASQKRSAVIKYNNKNHQWCCDDGYHENSKERAKKRNLGSRTGPGNISIWIVVVLLLAWM